MNCGGVANVKVLVRMVPRRSMRSRLCSARLMVASFGTVLAVLDGAVTSARVELVELVEEVLLSLLLSLLLSWDAVLGLQASPFGSVGGLGGCCCVAVWFCGLVGTGGAAGCGCRHRLASGRSGCQPFSQKNGGEGFPALWLGCIPQCQSGGSTPTVGELVLLGARNARLLRVSGMLASAGGKGPAVWAVISCKATSVWCNVCHATGGARRSCCTRSSQPVELLEWESHACSAGAAKRRAPA